MEHIAILDKKRKLLPKILSGEKTIESRRTLTKRAPYGKIATGDIVYFKDSGEPVSARARVKDVKFFCDPGIPTLKRIVRDYGRRICLKPDFDVKKVRAKYITLVFLQDVEPVKSFRIDKSGFGNANAWLVVQSVDSLRA
jgi:ASC-1-like (ASCH) protein